MNRFTNTLARVRIAAPCEADWDEMRGDERVRFCQHCSLNVYNLSAMTRREATRLVTRTEGARLCVRFYRRKDGTMLTQPCPIGLRALKRRVSRITSAVFASLIGFMAGIGLAPASKHMPNDENVPTTTAAPMSAMTYEEPPETDAMAVAGGYTFSEASPLGEQYGAGAALGIVLFVIGYPLALVRRRSESARREELRIWRNN